MLTDVFIKNLALIKEAEINFRSGLNILTGETGSGKTACFLLPIVQRIILSRALLKNKNIIILDESLNALEMNDEYTIINNILNKFSDKTIIYISHSNVCINLFSKILNFNN